MTETIYGLTIPFLGTTLGSACVFFMRKALNRTVQDLLTGFAAGVMTAASIWSLILPAIEQAEDLGRLAFIPAASGFMTGIVSLLITDRILNRIRSKNDTSERNETKLPKETMLLLAVTIHNIPEGMAVGAVCAGLLYGSGDISPAKVISISLGIGIQNFPEGAIISMPLRAGGKGRAQSFMIGTASGAAEALGAVLTIIAARTVIPLMPGILSFAAGAMIYVVVKELIPSLSGNENSDTGTIAYSAGFTFMMILDVAFG